MSPELDRALQATRATATGDATPDLKAALLPVMWRGLVDRPDANLCCTPIPDPEGRTDGLLVQLCLGSDLTASTASPSDRASRYAFMLHLSDALRRADDPDLVQELGTRMLGQELAVDQASFAEVNLAARHASERLEYRRDQSVPTQVIEHELGDFGPAIQSLCNGFPLVVADLMGAAQSSVEGIAAEILHYANAPLRAQLTVPIHRANGLVAVITVRRSEAHCWSVSEIATTHEAGTRIWEAIERARAEQAARETQQQFRALVTASAFAVYRMSPDWATIRHVEGKDYASNYAAPVPFRPEEHFLAEDQPIVLATIRQAIETQSVFELEHRVKRPDGSIGWVLSRAVPIMNEANEIIEWFGAASDVTQWRLAEEASRKATQALLEETQAADARKARLIAVLAHDLRRPLAALLGSLDLLRKSADAQVQEQAVEELRHGGQSMLTLIDNVLDLARLGAGDVILRPERFSPKELLDGVADILRPQAARHGTEVLTDEFHLPALIGDVQALRRVLVNFATNAAKATRGGHIRLSTAIGPPSPEGRDATFAVTDTGHGLAEADQRRLFRDFGMLERESETSEGTGLGLAICRRLADAMNGTVGVESSPGSGACFWLRVCLPEAIVESKASSAVGGGPGEVLTGLRVLVAEDDDIVRRLTCLNLERFGAHPVEAADGIEAVERAAEERFELIIMDISMPRLDGTAAASRIRHGSGPSANAMIVGVTAHQNPAIAALLSDRAMDACLSKPLNFDQLVASLRRDTRDEQGLVS